MPDDADAHQLKGTSIPNADDVTAVGAFANATVVNIGAQMNVPADAPNIRQEKSVDIGESRNVIQVMPPRTKVPKVTIHVRIVMVSKRS